MPSRAVDLLLGKSVTITQGIPYYCIRDAPQSKRKKKMAVSFSQPVVKENAVSVILTSDADLLSVTASDFSLRRSDTDAIISSSADISVATAARTGSNFNWNITIRNSTNYAGECFIRARSSGFIERAGFARVPTSHLDTSAFRFERATLPAPSTPTALSAAAIDHDSIRLTFGASTGTVTQYQYRYATSEAGLTSATWQDGGTGTTINVTGLPVDTLLYFQVRAVNRTEYSAASAVVSVKTAALPTPVSLGIEAIDPQKIPIGTEDYELIIDTSGEPDWASVRGDMEGFFLSDAGLCVW